MTNQFNLRLKSFRVGEHVRVTNKNSDYYGLTGSLFDSTGYGSGAVEFEDEDLLKARNPGRVIKRRIDESRGNKKVFFNFSELEAVKKKL